MVTGAIPMTAETSETARLRWVVNHPMTVAIIGAKNAATAPPTSSPIVMALEMPVRDQPVVSAMGFNKTGSEKTDPMATQPMMPPAATMTQRYEFSAIFLLPQAMNRTVLNSQSRF